MSGSLEVIQDDEVVAILGKELKPVQIDLLSVIGGFSPVSIPHWLQEKSAKKFLPEAAFRILFGGEDGFFQKRYSLHPPKFKELALIIKQPPLEPLH